MCDAKDRVMWSVAHSLQSVNLPLSYPPAPFTPLRLYQMWRRGFTISRKGRQFRLASLGA